MDENNFLWSCHFGALMNTYDVQICSEPKLNPPPPNTVQHYSQVIIFCSWFIQSVMLWTITKYSMVHFSGNILRVISVLFTYLGIQHLDQLDTTVKQQSFSNHNIGDLLRHLGVFCFLVFFEITVNKHIWGVVIKLFILKDLSILVGWCWSK